MTKHPIPLFLLALLAGQAFAQSPAPMRPPAVPLITHDPYFSIWSMEDNLTAQPTKHWTGSEQPLTGLIRIDETTYRLLGTSPRWAEPPIQPMRQVGFKLTPTRTIYGFEQSGVRLDFTFLTPALPHDFVQAGGAKYAALAIVAWLLTSPAHGARSTTSSGTSC